jgi:hypothetical protein
MPIVNLTHNPDGTVRVMRPVTVKVAIGLPPAEGSNFPKRLDHFVFQRKTSKRVEKTTPGANGQVKSGKFTNVVEWAINEDMTKHYGESCKEFWVVLLDEDPDVAFKTEMAMWTKTQCVCRGDGDDAKRLVKINDRESEWQERSCANDGCKELEMGLCKPHGALYFILEDFPSLGTIAKLQTTSYQSIREIRSALEDLRSVTGGRLMGVRAKITVRLENSRYKDSSGKTVTGTKHILGIELTASDIKQLTDGLAAGLMFDRVQKRLGAKSITIVEDPDEEQAESIAGEFFPPNDTTRPDVEEPSDEEIARMEAERTRVKAMTITEIISPKRTPPPPPAAAKPQAEESLEPGEITDDDLPGEMFGHDVDATPIGGAPDHRAQHFYLAWSKRKRSAEIVRKYLKEVHQVERSFDIRADRFLEALTWASSPLPDEAPPPMSDEEKKCREAFCALNIGLLQQMEIIGNNGSDWTKVYADINAIAEAGE